MNLQQDQQTLANTTSNTTSYPGYYQTMKVQETIKLCAICRNPEMPQHPLIPCTFCPRTYHFTCLPPEHSTVGPNWRCPHHRCNICLLTSTVPNPRDKTLFQCIHCLGLYCGSHLPPLTQRIPDHEIASYIPANGVVLINCGNCEVIQQRHRQQNSAFQQTKPSPEVHPTNNFERLRSSPGRRNSDAETKRRRDSLSITSDDYDILSETERRNKELVEQYNFATPDDSLRATIKELATQRAITQRELADYVGVSKSTISKYLNGKLKGTGIKSVEPKLTEWLERYYEGLRKNELKRQQQRFQQQQQQDLTKVYFHNQRPLTPYFPLSQVHTSPLNVLPSVHKINYTSSNAPDDVPPLMPVPTPGVSLAVMNTLPLTTGNPPTLINNNNNNNNNEGFVNNDDCLLNNLASSNQSNEIEFDINWRETYTYDN